MIKLHEILGKKTNQAISLLEMEINEYAWDYESLVEIISILREKRIPILGGDVYTMKNGIINTTFDLLYFESKSGTDYEASYKKAIEYLKIFETKEDKYVYSIVI